MITMINHFCERIFSGEPDCYIIMIIVMDGSCKAKIFLSRKLSAPTQPFTQIYTQT